MVIRGRGTLLHFEAAAPSRPSQTKAVMRLLAKRLDRRFEATPTGSLLSRMLSPLCGFVQRIGVGAIDEDAPQVVSLGAELTGVHTLLGTAPPPLGSYHIGGVGLTLEEALIKCLAEACERYAQLTAAYFGTIEIEFDSHERLAARGVAIVPARSLALFDEEMFSRPDFPFAAFDPTMPMGWVKWRSLKRNEWCRVPAQLALVGYLAQSHLGESRISVGVTTGTAAHTDRDKARLNALLELVQIDSAVGHWYGAWPARAIGLDHRTAR